MSGTKPLSFGITYFLSIFDLNENADLPYLLRKISIYKNLFLLNLVNILRILINCMFHY
jgi:hypothetical protein